MNGLKTKMLANAQIHRDYLVSAPIRLFVLDNLIEILSPGHRPNKLTVQKIRAGNSNIRNPILASYVAKGLLPFHGLGSGIKRALEKWPTIDFANDHDGCLFTATVHRKAVEELELVKITPKNSLINDTTSKKTPGEDRVKAQVGTTLGPSRSEIEGKATQSPTLSPTQQPTPSADPVVRLLSMVGWSNAVMCHVSSSPGPDRMKTIRSAVEVGRSLKIAR